jgi:Protein tyrosine and serine/threonine kinase
MRDNLYSSRSDVWAFAIVLWEIGTLGIEFLQYSLGPAMVCRYAKDTLSRQLSGRDHILESNGTPYDAKNVCDAMFSYTMTNFKFLKVISYLKKQ